MAIFKPTENIEEVKTLVQQLKQENKKVIVTSGCFDLLHYGHLDFFNKSKKFGDVLIVLVSVDADIQALKGDSRPIVPGWARAELVGALRVVDHVILHAGDIFHELLENLEPYKIVKGSDYANYKEHLANMAAYTRAGVELIHRDGVFSTTKIIDRCVASAALSK